jgi:phage/plasmid primase-like uncharacterized protein
MSEFIRDRLPDPIDYFDLEGVPLRGPGRWKTGPCHFHGGSDSLRVNVQSGAWVCMNCQMKGGDVLAYCMQRHDIGFVEAARALGAYIDDDKPHRGVAKATSLSARDAMQLISFELTVSVVVIADTRRGVALNDADWRRFLLSVGRVTALAQEYRS